MCHIGTFLAGIDRSDREQFAIIINDRTRHADHIARSLRSVLPDVSGGDVLNHRRNICDCYRGEQ